MYTYICYFLLDIRANQSGRAWVPWSIDSFENTLIPCTLHLISSHVLRYLLFSFGCSGEPVRSCVSSLKYRFLWKIQHIRVLYMHNIISYAYICYFLMDVRANWPDRAWVPWSIDSFENTLISCTLHLISSHVLRYLLFSFGCSGEPVQSCVSSLGYRFLWKIHYLHVLYMQYHAMYKNISNFLLDVRANQSSRAWVPWSIDSFEKYSTFVYFTCIISSHIRIYLLFLLWMFWRTGPTMREFPGV